MSFSFINFIEFWAFVEISKFHFVIICKFSSYSAKLALTEGAENDDSAYVLRLGVNGNSELLYGFDGTVLVSVPTPDILSGVESRYTHKIVKHAQVKYKNK